MSKPIVSIANLDNKSAAEAIIDYAGDFFASITLEDIPSILKDILDNLKSVGKQVIDKIKDFILNDFWGLVIDTKDIIKSLLNQQLDKALNCASRAMDKLEKVLDVLSYIPCLSVAIGVILIVVYICQLDFAAIASAAICMLGPLKILTKIFPKSKNIINKLMDFLVDFGKRFKDQAKTSLKALIRNNKTKNPVNTPKTIEPEVVNSATNTNSSYIFIGKKFPSSNTSSDIVVPQNTSNSPNTLQSIGLEEYRNGSLTNAASLKRYTENINKGKSLNNNFSQQNNDMSYNSINGLGSMNNANLLGQNIISSNTNSSLIRNNPGIGGINSQYEEYVLLQNNINPKVQEEYLFRKFVKNDTM